MGFSFLLYTTVAITGYLTFGRMTSVGTHVHVPVHCKLPSTTVPSFVHVCLALHNGLLSSLSIRRGVGASVRACVRASVRPCARAPVRWSVGRSVGRSARRSVCVHACVPASICPSVRWSRPPVCRVTGRLVLRSFHSIDLFGRSPLGPSVPRSASPKIWFAGPSAAPSDPRILGPPVDPCLCVCLCVCAHAHLTLCRATC